MEASERSGLEYTSVHLKTQYLLCQDTEEIPLLKLEKKDGQLKSSEMHKMFKLGVKSMESCVQERRKHRPSSPPCLQL